MKGSSQAKFFENRINDFEEWLNYTDGVIEYWVKVQ
jgi:hypothetical protein